MKSDNLLARGDFDWHMAGKGIGIELEGHQNCQCNAGNAQESKSESETKRQSKGSRWIEHPLI